MEPAAGFAARAAADRPPRGMDAEQNIDFRSRLFYCVGVLII
jgi:hypothetical protein